VTGPPQRASKLCPGKQRSLFTLWDRNCDDKLQIRELKEGIFKMDLNRDGILTEEEFKKYAGIH
jgi:hypothetical protein